MTKAADTAQASNVNQYYDSGTSGALNMANGGYQRWAPGPTSVALTVTGWPTSGIRGELTIEAVNLGVATITWPTVNWVYSDGSISTTFPASEVSLRNSGIDFIFLWTRNGGTTVYGKVMR